MTAAIETFADPFENDLLNEISTSWELEHILDLSLVFWSSEAERRHRAFEAWLGERSFTCGRCSEDFAVGPGDVEETDEIVCPRCRCTR